MAGLLFLPGAALPSAATQEAFATGRVPSLVFPNVTEMSAARISDAPKARSDTAAKIVLICMSLSFRSTDEL
jgi:hypothetical protein